MPCRKDIFTIVSHHISVSGMLKHNLRWSLYIPPVNGSCILPTNDSWISFLFYTLKFYISLILQMASCHRIKHTHPKTTWRSQKSSWKQLQLSSRKRHPMGKRRANLQLKMNHKVFPFNDNSFQITNSLLFSSLPMVTYIFPTCVQWSVKRLLLLRLRPWSLILRLEAPLDRMWEILILYL